MLLFLITLQGFSQEELDIEIDRANELYTSGNIDSAVSIWKDVANNADKPSSTYGAALRNILFYYISIKNDEQIIAQYNIIMNAGLNDKDRNYEMGKPYKNYKYNSTIDIAGYFANKGDFEKSYYYMHKADTEIQYETSSLTSFMYRKIELAIWKYHLLKDMKRNNEAVAVLITRAFEYDYKNMYPDWASFSNNQYEEELAQLICSEFNSLKKLMIEIDNGIENLIFDAKKNKIQLTLFGLDYEISLYSKFETKDECREYLKNSVFYSYLSNSITKK